MNLAQIKHHYWTYYESIEFERMGLFECVRNELGDGEVLYLGSSAHVTPSFIFQNVTYNDISETSRNFFSDMDTVNTFIKKRKKYSSSPYLMFLEEDYNREITVKQYDLVFAIFSPGSLGATSQYVKQGGFVVYLPLPSENRTANSGRRLIEKGHIRVIKGKYKYLEDQPRIRNKTKDMVGNKFRDVYAYSVLQAL